MSRIPSQSTERSRVLLAGSLIALITFVSYLPVLRAGFLWDDDVMLTNNSFVKLPLGLYYIWFSTALPDYFPLTSTSFWLEWRIWHMNAAGYHLTNVLLHAVSSILFWRILRRLAVPGAWVAAVVFAVHPVNVESVAWITERKNTLSMFFAMLSIWWYFNSQPNESGTSPHVSRSYWLSLLAFVLSLLAKTSTVTLPCVLLLLEWWRSAPSYKFRQSVLRLAPFFFASLALGLVTVWFQANRAIGEEVIRNDTLASRLAGAGWAVWFYLFKALFPLNLSFVYPHWEISAHLWPAWLPFLGLIIGFAVCWSFRNRWGRACLAGFGVFLLMLLPVLGFLNIYFQRYSLVADHWQYFGLTGIIPLVIGGAATLFQRWASPTPPHKPVNTPVFGDVVSTLVILAFSFLTWSQTHIYSNNETLWRDTLKKNPTSWLALNNLGNVLMAQGDVAGAKALHLQSLESNPKQMEAHNNLGEILLLEGHVAEAKEHYLRALEINPRVALTLYNLANALDREGKTDEAVATYRKAMELDPFHAEARNNLGCLLYAAGRTSEAIEEFVRAVSLRPNYADAINNLGAVFQDRGQSAEAESQFREAIRLDPFHADAQFNLGNVLLSQGRTAEAGPAFLRAVQLNPQNALAHCRLSTVLWRLGKNEAAYNEITTALKLQPTLAEAHHQMGVMLVAKKDFAGALNSLRRANQLHTNWPEGLASLGFTLATAPASSDRNGAEAMQLCNRAVELTYQTNAVALDAFAAACAETGQFDEAVRIAAQAVRLESAAGRTNRAALIQTRQRLYEAGKPYHDQPGA